jgi:hypothetical protein
MSMQTFCTIEQLFWPEDQDDGSKLTRDMLQRLL